MSETATTEQLTPEMFPASDEDNALLLDAPFAMPGQIRITRRQASVSRRPGLREMQCEVFTHLPLGYGWWIEPGRGTSGERRDAVPHTVRYVLDNSTDPCILYINVADFNVGISPEAVADVAPPTLEPPPPPVPKRKCAMLSVLPASVINMLKTAPNNNTFRAKAMAILGELPPADCDTFAKIKDWVEFNFPKSGSGPAASAVSQITLSISKYRTEHGHCRFRRSVSGSGTITLKFEEVMDAIKQSVDNEDSYDDLMYRVADLAGDQIECNTTDTEDISERDTDDVDDESLDYNSSALRTMLRAFVSANCSDEDHEILEGVSNE